MFISVSASFFNPKVYVEVHDDQFVINLYVNVCEIFERHFTYRVHTLGELIILKSRNDVCCAQCPCGKNSTFLKV